MWRAGRHAAPAQLRCQNAWGILLEMIETVTNGAVVNWEINIYFILSASPAGCRAPSCLLGWRQRGLLLLHWRNSMPTLTRSPLLTITIISLPTMVRLIQKLLDECNRKCSWKQVWLHSASFATLWTSWLVWFDMLTCFLWQVTWSLIHLHYFRQQNSQCHIT